jgi:hypothetical protein
MKRSDVSYIVSILLLISLTVTAALGYIQSQLELRKFVPHRYFAYTTLSLAVVHLYFNFGKIVKYLRHVGRKRQEPEKNH